MASARLIKKYPNRRLYDTQTSTYITLADVKQLVIDQEEFQVIDAKSSEDLTRPILLQIILEEEQAGMPMFTSPVLSQIIRFYGNAMQGIMGSYWRRTSRPSSISSASFRSRAAPSTIPTRSGRKPGRSSSTCRRR